MPITMNKVLRQCKSPFYFFLDLGEFYQAQQFKFFGFQLDELFQYINLYLKEQYEDELIEDYLRLSKVKPKYCNFSSISESKFVFFFLGTGFLLSTFQIYHKKS